MDELRLSRGQALGNDYLVADAGTLPWPLTPARVRALCDRHRGIGSDGILLADLTRRPFGLRIFNPDGSEAEKSGNGLRILAAWLHGRGLVGEQAFGVQLARDEVVLQVLGRLDAGALDVVAEMGTADFRGGAAGFTPEPGVALGHRLHVGEEVLVVNPLSLGNPHCVVFVEALRREEFERRGPLLATHPAFPAGVNVQFAVPRTPATIEAWIWERGAGETLASGSSACAVAAAAVRLGRAHAGAIAVVMPGGTARVEVSDDYELRLRAPAQIVCDCILAPGFVEGLGKL